MVILPEMTPEVIYCAAQTFRGWGLEPSEYCENEVDDYGDLCPAHDTEARDEDDYDRYLQSKED